MEFIGIIPARYDSVRFPGKPLIDLGGKSMIVRTYEQVSRVKKLSKAVVATDDERIYQEVISAGGNAVMTARTHTSGTDRCAEALAILGCEPNNTVVLNIQGDEPFIQPEQIEELIACFDNSTVEIATLIKRIETEEMLHNPNVVKVVVADTGKALYFGRYAIPFLRNISFGEAVFYKHIGIYAYRARVLNELVQLPPSSLEKAESLEQLRWLQAGYQIQTLETQYEDTIGIDTPQDLELWEMKKNNSIHILK
jgi:3-deoxy-manno-octulosonate cytidylyltransferase (CMP-KDO synthetase)